MADKNRGEGPSLRVIPFVAGLVIALGAALLLVLGVIESGWAAAIGIVGIGVIATSRSSSRTGSKRH
ncbi:MAG: hypothetical protein WCE80_04400 [Acidimicrobiia bacterium]